MLAQNLNQREPIRVRGQDAMSADGDQHEGLDVFQEFAFSEDNKSHLTLADESMQDSLRLPAWYRRKLGRK